VVIFTSGTQAIQGRTVNHDPEPYVVGYDSAGPIRISGTGLSERVWVLENNYLARPEFDVLDNPILAAFRDSPELDLWDMGFAMHATYGGERDWEDSGHYFHAFTTATEEQVDHARRVLTRLAALTKEG
jgi:hypothetical protein